MIHRAAALAAIAATHRTIAVAGSHGKTTTSSMLALILREAGWRPSFLIGGELNEVGTNAAYGDGGWLVVEADESDGTFLRIAPAAAIVTNVEPDHLDHYGGFDPLVAAFERFIDGVTGSGRVRHGRAGRRRDRGGSSARADVRRAPRRRLPGRRLPRECRGLPLRARRPTASALGELVVPMGVKAATNAAGAAAMALELGVEFDDIVRALRGFGGVARRFQYRGERDGVAFVDDYAHLPAEVAAAIAAAREAFAGSGHRGVPTAPLLPHRVAVGRLRRRVQSAPTRCSSPTCTPPAKHRSRA